MYICATITTANFYHLKSTLYPLVIPFVVPHTPQP